MQSVGAAAFRLKHVCDLPNRQVEGSDGGCEDSDA